MRVAIVTRIFAPEVSAASGLLSSWARAFRDAGWKVSVVTTVPPKGVSAVDPTDINVRRAPVLRDRQQYVRGYLSYLSFDLPLFFRLLFSRRPDLYIVEPPPTSVAVVRVMSFLKRAPYIVDAADLWSDAAAVVTRSRTVLTALRALELWGLRGARHLLVAHEPLAARIRQLGVGTPATAIGFGADAHVFHHLGREAADPPTLVYAGTHSEWHGAGVFVEAMARLLPKHPGARMRFIGNGQERELLRRLARSLGVDHAVSFEEPIAPDALNEILNDATVSLASLKPAMGYDYAFTTKVYSSLAAGCPVVFAGVGPTVAFFHSAPVPLAGVAVPYDVQAVTEALDQACSTPLRAAERARISEWTRDSHSLEALARKVVSTSVAALKV